MKVYGKSIDDYSTNELEIMIEILKTEIKLREEEE